MMIVKDDIMIVDNLLTKEECEKIIEVFENAPDHLKLGASAFADGVREGTCLIMDNKAETIEGEKLLYRAISKCIKYMFKEYNIQQLDYINSVGDSGYEVVKYEIGQVCNLHVDSPIQRGNKIRIATTLTHLNTCNSKTVFPRQRRVVDTVQGRSIIFPPAHTHGHYVDAPTNTVRYVCVSWITIKEPQWQIKD